MANQRLSLVYGTCCVEEDKQCVGVPVPDDPLAPPCAAADRPVCISTPKTKLPKWLLESEYFEDPKLMRAKEGFSAGLAGPHSRLGYVHSLWTTLPAHAPQRPHTH